SCVGVLTPLRDIFARPLRSRSSSGAQRKRTRRSTLEVAGGLLCLAATTAVLLIAPQSAVLGIATLIVGLLLLMPALLRTVFAAFDRLQRPLASGSARLAAVELQSSAAHTRSLAIAATGAIAVFAGVTIQGATANLQEGLDRLFGDVTSVAD